MQDIVGDGFFEWYIALNKLIISPNFAKTLGGSIDQFDTKAEWRSIIHPTHYDTFLEMLGAYLSAPPSEQSIPFHYEALAKHHKQGGLWLQIKCSVIDRDEAGRPLLAVGSIQDINESHAQREQIMLLHQRLSLAIEVSRTGVWDWDIQQDRLVWDARMYETYGIQESDFSSAYEAWVQALHPEDKARAEEEIKHALAGVKPFNTAFRIICPNGEIRHLVACAELLRDEQGQATRMVGVNIDNTEVVHRQEGLARATMN
jgi:PAS domain-containing protein